MESAVFVNILNSSTELELRAYGYIIDNLKYKPEIIKFTYNLSSVMYQWYKFESCWNEISSNYDIVKFRDLVKFTGRSLNGAKLCAEKSSMFAKLMYFEWRFINPNVFNDSVVVSCRANLVMASNLINKIRDIVVNNIIHVQRDFLLRMSEEMNLTIQRCLVNVDTIERERLDLFLTSSSPSVSPLSLFRVDIGLQDFIRGLGSRVNKIVKENLLYEPDFIKFTYNLSLLIEQCVQFKDYLNRLNYSQKFQSLFLLIDENLYNAKLCAIKSNIFLELEGQEKGVIYHQMYGSVLLSCRHHLTTVNSLIKIVCNMLDKDGDVTKNNILIVAERMDLLIQNCLENMEAIDKKLIVNTSKYKLKLISCLNNIEVQKQEQLLNVAVPNLELACQLRDVRSCRQERQLDVTMDLASESGDVDVVERETFVTDLSDVSVSIGSVIVKR